MNRVGKALVIMGLTVGGLFVVAALAGANEHEAKAAMAMAQAEESLRVGRANAEELERLRAEMLTLKSKVDRLGCPCGPDCDCPPGLCPNCPTRTTTVKPATGGHWNCGPGGCRFVPDRPTTGTTPALPKPAGDGWQWSDEGGYWFRRVSSVPAVRRVAPAPAPVRVVIAPAPRPITHVSSSYRTRSTSTPPFAVGVAGTTSATPVRIAGGRTIRPMYNAAPAPYRAHTATRAVAVRAGSTTNCSSGFG
jgi:hypothetical protein